MAADPIRDALARVWDTGGRQFATFEVAPDGRPDPDRWVQWIDGEINLRWPYEEDPRTALPRLGVRLPARATVQWHVPGENVCIGAWDVRIDDTAALVRSLLEHALGGGPRCEVAVREESQ